MELFLLILNFVAVMSPCFMSVLGQTANVPPSLIKGLPSEPVYFYKTLNLFCLASGTSEGLQYNWYIDDVPLDTNKYAATHDTTTGLLTITEPVPEGYYQCKARNSYGVAISYITLVRKIKFEADQSDRNLQLSARIGDKFIIPCNTTGAQIVPSAVYSWQLVKNREDSNFKRIDPNRRLQTDEQGNLHIAYVMQSDDQAGTGYPLYRCNLINTMDNSRSMSLSFTSLQVSGPAVSNPELSVLFVTPSPVTGLMGGNVRLRCFFGGRPDIGISWRRADGKTMIGSRFNTGDPVTNSGWLTINSLQLDDAGSYVCTGRSDAAPPLSIEKTIELKVEASPYFRDTLQAPMNTKGTVGRSVTINCNAAAIPDVSQIIWYRNGSEIKKNPLPRKYSMSSDGKSLIINELCKGCGDEGDLGVIQCNSSNLHGYVLGQGYINVFDPTVIVTPPVDATLRYPDPIQFSCKATTDRFTNLTYTWSLNGEPVYDGRVNTSVDGYLTIDIAQLEDKGIGFLGEWQCHASNGISYDSKSAKLVELVVRESKETWKYWWIILIVLLVLLLIALVTLLVLCCLYQNRGNQYPVDEKERKIGNDPEKELAEHGFHNYQRPAGVDGITVSEIKAEFPKSSDPGSINDSIDKPYSEDNMSLNDYSNPNQGKFTEDGSFIPQYNPYISHQNGNIGQTPFDSAA